MIGPKNSCYSLNQSDAKLKLTLTWSFAFSRALDNLAVFTLSSHWLSKIFCFLLIGRCDYFGFGFMTLNRKALIRNVNCLLIYPSAALLGGSSVVIISPSRCSRSKRKTK